MKMFDKLKPFQTIEFVLMILLAAAIPFDWLVAQYFEVGLLVCAVFKIIFEQKFKFNKNQTSYKWVYIVFMATWLIYFIGMAYTENTSEGWSQVSKKLGFLIFPLIFLFSDLSYLTKTRVRIICYSLTISTVLFFLINLVPALYDYIFNNAEAIRFFDTELMSIVYVHHSYMAMYVAFAIAFCLIELFLDNNRYLILLDIFCLILLSVFTILLNSRAGLVCYVLLIFILFIWIIFVKKHIKAGLIIMSSIIAIVITILCIFPISITRVTKTFTDIKSEKSSDRRIVQYNGYKQLLFDNWLTGVGTGDRSDEIVKYYIEYRNVILDIVKPAGNISDSVFKKDRILCMEYLKNIDKHQKINAARQSIKQTASKYHCDAESVDKALIKYIYIEEAIDKGYNAHNQYFDTTIAVGMAGLLLMLAYFAIPIVLFFKERKFDILYFSFLWIIFINVMFESIFETQKGIIFFAFFNVLLFYFTFCQKKEDYNKENSLVK